jgi:hypothetical protein
VYCTAVLLQAGLLISLLSTWLPLLLLCTLCCVLYSCLFTGGDTHLLAEHLAVSAVVVYTVYCTAVCLQAGILISLLSTWLPLLDPVASSILKDMERPGEHRTPANVITQRKSVM